VKSGGRIRVPVVYSIRAMRYRFQLPVHRGLWRLGLAALLVLVPTLASATDSLVFFKNGRVLRVLDHRDEGEWVFLVVGEPRPNPKDPKEEGPNEIGVRADSIDRIEDAKGGPKRRTAIANSGRSANGVVRPMSEEDARAAALSSTAGGGSMAEALAKVANVPNVPTQGTAEAKQYRPTSNAPDIEPGSSIAGWEMKKGLKNLRPPKHLLDRAKMLNEQKRREKEMQMAAGEFVPYSPPTDDVGSGVYDPKGILAQKRAEAAAAAAKAKAEAEAAAAEAEADGSGQDDSPGQDR
jgi:hypothetical protein